MKYLVIVFIFTLGLVAAGGASAQVKTKAIGADEAISKNLRSSAAFAEILLRKTELQSDLEEMLVSYTEEYPKIKETRYELKVLEGDILKLEKVKADESGKLTSALGKLLIRKATVKTDYWVLTNRFNDEHPEVKRAKRKLEIFDKAVNQIL